MCCETLQPHSLYTTLPTASSLHALSIASVTTDTEIFIAEKGSVLLVEKLCATLSCKQCLRGGEIRGFSYQILSLCN